MEKNLKFRNPKNIAKHATQETRNSRKMLLRPQGLGVVVDMFKLAPMIIIPKLNVEMLKQARPADMLAKNKTQQSL